MNAPTNGRSGACVRRAPAVAVVTAACMLLAAGCSSSGKGNGSSGAGRSTDTGGGPSASAPISKSVPSSASVVPSTPELSSTAESSTAESSASGGQIAGSWNGTYASSKFATATGSFAVVFTQKGNIIAGTIKLNGGCVSTGTISGTLSGNTISFGSVHGAGTVAFDGTISGDSMRGSYKSGASCGNDAGTWQANR